MKTILVIDDDSGIREALSEMLSNEGYSVMTAENGEVGVVRMKEKKPNLILLDMRMPIMDGWEFKKEMDADQSFANIPVLVFSAFSGKVPGIKAHGIIEKPISVKAILKSIRLHVA